ncbi:hypothetical protein DXG01_006114 [Tephrocybe rancida]|nr:hypothetical protein DXG01_006114 [Tephrocybe rancida]
MRLSIALSTLAVATLGLAQENQVILVGSTTDAPGGIFQFIPPSINATNGTTITFRFTGAPGNHSITQSTFSDPCDPTPGGFDSGWVSIPGNNVTTTPEWNLTITNTTTPLWFFCKQLVPLVHCSAGMVGAINARESGNLTFSNYQANAKNFKGQSGQGEGSLVGHGASASVGPGPQASGAQFYTGAPVSSATAPSSPGNTTAPGGGSGGGNGALTMAANSLVVTLGVVVGAFLCLA